MAQQPILVYSTLGRRVYIVTKYKDRGDGRIEAQRKFDVTDQFCKVANEFKVDQILGPHFR